MGECSPARRDLQRTWRRESASVSYSRRANSDAVRTQNTSLQALNMAKGHVLIVFKHTS